MCLTCTVCNLNSCSTAIKYAITFQHWKTGCTDENSYLQEKKSRNQRTISLKTIMSRLDKSLILQISSLLGYFKKINAFLVYSICLHKTFHNKWCLDKTVGQIENGLERGFVKLWLTYV